jgi:hypothetical protein
MEFWKTILGLVRRRDVGLPVLALSLLAAGLAFFLIPTHYVSATTMVLTTPTAGGTLSQDPARPSGLTNPLLNFDDGLRTAATIVIHAMNTPEVMTELGAGKDSSTTVTIADGSANPDLLGTTGPFVYIEGDGTSPDQARGVVLRAQQRVRDELVNRQRDLGAPPVTFITMVDVVPPSTPEAQLGAKWQAGAVVLVLGIAFGLTGTYAAQRVLETRRRRRPADGSGEGATESDAATLFRAHTQVAAHVANGVPRRWPVTLTGSHRPDARWRPSPVVRNGGSAPAPNGTPGPALNGSPADNGAVSPPPEHAQDPAPSH